MYLFSSLQEMPVETFDLGKGIKTSHFHNSKHIITTLKLLTWEKGLRHVTRTHRCQISSEALKLLTWEKGLRPDRFSIIQRDTFELKLLTWEKGLSCLSHYKSSYTLLVETFDLGKGIKTRPNRDTH